MNTSHFDPRPLRSQQLAVIAKGFFDIPPGTRSLLIVAALCGVVIVVVASLMGNKPTTVEVDKILHFSGYFVLSFVLVLGLRPTLYIPALLGLIGMGFVIEVIQPLNGRSKDVEDAIANSIGVGVGMVVGVIVRRILAYVRKELTIASVRRRLRSYPPGKTIMREGARLSTFYIIKSGQVRLLKRSEKGNKEIATMGPGDVIGVMSIVNGSPQYATVEAVQPTTLYGMDLSEMMESVGGMNHPVSLVLATFADKLRESVDRIHELESAQAATD